MIVQATGGTHGTITYQYDKGLVIKYGEGGLQNGKIAGPKLFAPPPQDRVKLFAPPLLKSGNFMRPPPTIWLKLQAIT